MMSVLYMHAMALYHDFLPSLIPESRKIFMAGRNASNFR